MLNHYFSQHDAVHDGLWFTGAKAAELLTVPLSFALSLSRRWTGAPPKPCSSGPSPNCRALDGLLFIAVKVLTPYCAVVSGWIQSRALLCRPQLFYALVGWLWGSGSRLIFQICLDGLTLSLHCVRVITSLFFFFVMYIILILEHVLQNVPLSFHFPTYKKAFTSVVSAQVCMSLWFPTTYVFQATAADTSMYSWKKWQLLAPVNSHGVVYLSCSLGRLNIFSPISPVTCQTMNWRSLRPSGGSINWSIPPGK